MSPHTFLPILLVVALCMPRLAEAGNTKKHVVLHHHTVIESVSADSITIQTTNVKGGDTKTYKITAATEITFNGQTAAASQLEAGQRVHVTPDSADETAAALIAASDPPPADETPKK